MMLLPTTHFTVAEVQRASSSLTADQLNAKAMSDNVALTLALMERVRSALGGRAVTLTSLARSADRNTAEGGSDTSAHLKGLAADFRVAGLTPDQVFTMLKGQAATLGIDQLIAYNTHTHVSADPRRRGQILDLRRRGFVIGGVIVAVALLGALIYVTRGMRGVA
jgi:zinc D-Ala-D-Ala carboxypeptidase